MANQPEPESERTNTRLSGTTQRDNDITDKAMHPQRQQSRGQNESQSRDRQQEQGQDVPVGESPERDKVDQDPGHRQKENQGDKKDDPLAA